jgi:hypothetical protein
LTDRNIGNSRDTSFEQLIMSETNGRGVDLVLNSLSEEKLQASVRCLAPGGRFLEIGIYDLENNTPLGRLYFFYMINFCWCNKFGLFIAAVRANVISVVVECLGVSQITHLSHYHLISASHLHAFLLVGVPSVLENHTADTTIVVAPRIAPPICRGLAWWLLSIPPRCLHLWWCAGCS